MQANEDDVPIPAPRSVASPVARSRPERTPQDARSPQAEPDPNRKPPVPTAKVNRIGHLLEQEDLFCFILLVFGDLIQPLSPVASQFRAKNLEKSRVFEPWGELSEPLSAAIVVCRTPWAFAGCRNLGTSELAGFGEPRHASAGGCRRSWPDFVCVTNQQPKYQLQTLNLGGRVFFFFFLIFFFWCPRERSRRASLHSEAWSLLAAQRPV